jgi:biotin transporter BioY
MSVASAIFGAIATSNAAAAAQAAFLSLAIIGLPLIPISPDD